MERVQLVHVLELVANMAIVIMENVCVTKGGKENSVIRCHVTELIVDNMEDVAKGSVYVTKDGRDNIVKRINANM
jgi:hypothetical protein